MFVVAAAEGWQLTDEGPDHKVLVIGNESWPFPVPLVSESGRWRFDTEAGTEEVITRRIGRNELAVIDTCRTYVAAQRLYARDGHDGKPAGLYARTFNSERGKQNGLYWPHTPGGKRSPLGDWLAQAATDGQTLPAQAGQPPATFHGYQFRILTSQGAAAPGGAKSYLVDGEMSAGFALVAWPAQYRRHRRDDVHRQSIRCAVREGSRARHCGAGARDAVLRSGRHLEEGAVASRIAGRVL